MAEVVPSALGQAFYLSPEFSALTVETRDYRLHPVLGGISSTRWHAYQRFERRQSYLVEQLANQPMAASALQLVGKTGDGSAGPEPPKSWAIQRVQSKKARLKEQGVLAGQRGRNRLIGSRGDDVLMGWGGRDVLIGGRGDDLLSGGAGAPMSFAFVGAIVAVNNPIPTRSLTSIQSRGIASRSQASVGMSEWRGSPVNRGRFRPWSGWLMC